MTTALYRRYRPETFQEVIGQEHVTDPLMAALRADRVTHAYLFSGPRGCGKTTSARIFARCLNCAQGPTDTPCGTCASCVDLARGGAGSIDVVEMDAASHGGVDDARELRERAAFAPARDRYKIFIIDEAHMVSSAGFNALLKIVEEPPPHVKFIFATTEPEKVIGTIRSRTHHYPFRLVPPERLLAYLEQLCATEGVQVGGGVLPMVIRAGGGSVRDTLSVLDQLIAGAQDGVLGYDRAVALLGYTDAAMLDSVVEALAARDGASLFKVVDRVIGSGHDPRRFVEDVLQRLRDLVVIAMAGEQATAALHGMPEDQLERMRTQAAHLGPAELSRAADLVNDALTEMTGATSPRLQLELLCARLLLPGADDAALGYAARLDRLEREVASGVPVRPAAGAAPPPVAPAAGAGVPPVAAAPGPARDQDAAAAAAAAAQAPASADRPADTPARSEAASAPVARPAAAAAGPGGGADATAGRGAAVPAPAGPGAAVPAASGPRGTAPAAPRGPAAPAAPPAATTAPAAARPTAQEGGGVDAELIRNRWPEVVATLARLKRSTWTLVSQNAQVGEVSGGVLRLVFTTPGLATAFRSGPHAAPVQQALTETLGVNVRIDAIASDGSGAPGMPAPAGTAPSASSTAPAGSVPSAVTPPSAVESARESWRGTGAAQQPGTPPRPGPAAQAGVGDDRRPAGRAPAHAGPDHAAPAPADDYPLPTEPVDDDPGPGYFDDAGPIAPAAGAPARPAPSAPGGLSTPPAAPSAPAAALSAPAAAPSAPGAARGPAGRPSASGGPAPAPRPRVAPADDVASLDDPDAEGSGLVGAPLVAKVLGGQVIEEISLPPQGVV
ncbi:DNA polymerase III subunit gamma and tau [Georgenia sp. AZ-5]|uniref:DNA polymerase III subunit gamma and tau n=1 Tax=Georgenia sp. AZ-5 TaxID=3367526 RepID=UPI0037546A51